MIVTRVPDYRPSEIRRPPHGLTPIGACRTFRRIAAIVGALTRRNGPLERQSVANSTKSFGVRRRSTPGSVGQAHHDLTEPVPVVGQAIVAEHAASALV